MKQRASPGQKTPATTTHLPGPETAPTSAEAATVPPLSGVEMVDRQPVQAVLGSGQVHQSLESATWPGWSGTIQRQAQPPGVSSHLSVRPQENKTGLPDNLKAGIERLSGLAMDDVRVHYNSAKPAQLQALAYTQGTDIHVGPGQERHLPHEAWHVVQQKQGRVKPTIQARSMLINSEVGLEQEAEEMGARARQVSEGNRPTAIGSDSASTRLGVKTSLMEQPVQKLGPTETPVIQRAIGLELEFPIPVDELGALSKEQEALLAQPISNNERIEFQKSANLDKDKTILEDKAGGFKIVVDHQITPLENLMANVPAQVIWGNVLEFVFKPPVQFPLEIYYVLEKIYKKVAEIDTLTSGLSKRKQLVGNYYVGPINTDAKPAELSTKSNSLQVNVGVETQVIADFIGAFASASELAGKDKLQISFREYLTKARAVARTMIEQVREAEEDRPLFPKEGEDWPRLELRGLEGLFAVIALYLLAGATETAAPGTVKNFTPLLLKTPLSDLADRTLSKKEQDLWKFQKFSYLSTLLKLTRGKEAFIFDLLVRSSKGVATGVKVEDLITSEFKAPFIVAGKALSAKEVVHSLDKSPTSRKGAVFETRYSRGDFDLEAANERAQEVYKLVNKLHGS